MRRAGATVYGIVGVAEGGFIRHGDRPMEFLNFVLIFLTAWLVVRHPEREHLAFSILIVSVLLMVALFSIATRTSILPGVNY